MAEKFVELFGLTDDPADADGYVRTAFEKAVSKVYNGGYKIYTTQNPKIQDITESVFENTNYANYTDSKGEPSRPPSPLWTPIPATWWPW